LAGLLIIVLALVIYLLPAIIAGSRNKTSGTAGVVLLNIFLGWTLIGWLAAFIWACTGRTVADEQLEARRHAEMLKALEKR
jgi:RsiW-degrading membrane proteinase PrsW (M82 family)